MENLNLIYAKFHLPEKMSIKGYFDPRHEPRIPFLELFDENHKPVGAVSVASVIYIEYLDAE